MLHMPRTPRSANSATPSPSGSHAAPGRAKAQAGCDAPAHSAPWPNRWRASSCALLHATWRTLTGLVSWRAFLLALLPAAAAMLFVQRTLAPLPAASMAHEQTLLAEARDQRLAATVTALAQALGELAATQPDENARRELLVRAVDPVRTSTARWDYVFLSQGTVNVHTPTLPDAGGVDFGEATDTHGVRFVQRMMDTGRSGGGFTDWTAPLGEGRTEARRAYSLAVPGTDYWLGAWAPAAPAMRQDDRNTTRTTDFTTGRALRTGWGVAVCAALLAGVVARRRETRADTGPENAP